MNVLMETGFSNLLGSVSEDLAPMIVAVMLMMIPIVAILTSHQRKMAKIMREDDRAMNPRAAHEADSVKRELAELKALMHQQAIAIDNLATRVNAPAEISQRLENVGR